MAKKLTFDTGIKEFEINGNEMLRFNPSDPNVYSRFKEFESEILKMYDEVRNVEIKTGSDAVDYMKSYDQKVKAKLSYVFGESNDFEKILGVNVMAVAGNGELIITNFLNAISPIISDGVKEYAKLKAKSGRGNT